MLGFPLGSTYKPSTTIMPRYTAPNPRRQGRSKKRGFSGVRKKTSYRKKAEYQKKTQRPYFNKKFDYQVKKHDVMLASATPQLVTINETDAIATLGTTGMRFTIWSPSYRVANTAARPRDRISTNCLFVGVAEKLLFIGSGDVSHRRIVLWSRVSLDEAMPMSGPNETLLRNILQRNPATDTLLDQFLNGTRGQDFFASTIFLQGFDKNAVDVVYDRTVRYNQQGNIIKTSKFWHRCEREISYQDKESGMNVSHSGWSGLSSGSGGNLYVVDMYVNRGVMNVNFKTDVYWHEP